MREGRGSRRVVDTQALGAGWRGNRLPTIMNEFEPPRELLVSTNSAPPPLSKKKKQRSTPNLIHLVTCRSRSAAHVLPLSLPSIPAAHHESGRSKPPNPSAFGLRSALTCFLAASIPSVLPPSTPAALVNAEGAGQVWSVAAVKLRGGGRWPTTPYSMFRQSLYEYIKNTKTV
ncbi:hypothetical protein SETIT_2G145000v2 [Setaria italica]|uniref:Uncharacterized protein n=1 Tax=Setaria italica TaxID=4555 RepID=A0A368PYM8_SETIT|nr:hypothetical protein SETIT_2G145000v2 [Setaria italica]